MVDMAINTEVVEFDSFAEDGQSETLQPDAELVAKYFQRKMKATILKRSHPQ